MYKDVIRLFIMTSTGNRHEVKDPTKCLVRRRQQPPITDDTPTPMNRLPFDGLVSGSKPVSHSAAFTLQGVVTWGLRVNIKVHD